MIIGTSTGSLTGNGPYNNIMIQRIEHIVFLGAVIIKKSAHRPLILSYWNTSCTTELVKVRSL